MIAMPASVTSPPAIIVGVTGLPNTTAATITDSSGVGRVSGDTVETG